MRIDVTLDPENDEGGEHGWLKHPFTQVVSRAARKQQAQALNHLLSTCSVSSDPAVRESAARYDAYRMVADFTEGKNG